MTRRQAAHRKRTQNRFAIGLITMVVVMITIGVAVKTVELNQKVADYSAMEAKLESQIQAEQDRQEELEEYEKYTHTKKYIEDVAKDKLGLVYDDEIIFREEE